MKKTRKTKLTSIFQSAAQIKGAIIMAECLIHGVGTNDLSRKLNVRIKDDKELFAIYGVWKNMIYRCYAKNRQRKHPTYIDCTVCPEWMVFSNFKKWVEKQNWQGLFIDKDIIKPGNKIYCPEFCCFVPRITNNLLTKNTARRGRHPIGVTIDKESGKFKVRCGINRERIYLGRFNTSSEAHSMYVKTKSNLVAKVAAQQTDKRISNGLMRHAALIAIGEQT